MTSIGDDVSDTAFITGYYRSLNEALSQDPWSKLWMTEKAKELGDAFVNEVSPHDPVNIQLRSRFFLEALRRYSKKHEQFGFINLGAGFTTYPYHDFMINQAISFEYDQESVVSLKKTTADKYQQRGLLPQNNHIHYVGLNFDIDSYQKKIDDSLKLLSGSQRPVFVLMEGFFYYLQKETSESLWSLLVSRLPKASRVGVVYLKPEVEKSSAFKRAQKFLIDHCGFNGMQLLYHEKEYFLKGRLTEIDSASHVEAESRYLGENNFNNDNTFNEEMLIVEI